jgi:glutamate synthase (NADPH/NADH) large chain
MSGGVAYVYDINGDFAKKCNMEMVKLDPVLSTADQQAKIDPSIWHSEQRGGVAETDEVILKRLVERHAQYTGSERANLLLKDWTNSRSKFVKVFPDEYKRALGEIFLSRNKAANVLKEVGHG